MKSSLKIALIAVVLLSMSACIRVDTSTKEPTIGDQIIDLVKAKQMGVISEQEFKRLRSMALARF